MLAIFKQTRNLFVGLLLTTVMCVNSTTSFAGDSFSLGHSGTNYYLTQWNPSKIADLKAWFRADSNTLDTTGGTNTISALTNLASTGVNYNATQTTKANQCLYLPNLYRSKGVMRCDGVNDFMSIPNGLETGKDVLGISLVVVYNVTVGASDISVAEIENNNNSTRFKALIKGSPSGRYDLTVRRLDADTPATVSSTSNSAGGASIAVFVANYDLVTGTIYLNNVAIRSSTALSGLTLGKTSNTNSTNIRLFSNGQANGEFLPADVLEVMVYTHPLSAFEVNQLYVYANNVYGLGL